MGREIAIKNYEDWQLEQLKNAYFEARKGKRKTVDEYNIEIFLMENLKQLNKDILSFNYKPSPGVAFIVKKPKPREVFAAPFRDRVVHHFLADMSMDWLDRRLIRDSYSCRINKGTLDAVQRLEHHIRSVSQNYEKEAYVIKMDISSYFMSLDREALVERMQELLDWQFAGVKDERLHRILSFLWRQVLTDEPTKGAKRRGPFSDWDLLEPGKSLYETPPGKGIVIGNLSSQMVSNAYLDKMDRFITMDLGYHHYGRYVDDFYIITSAAELKRTMKDIRVIREFLSCELGLTLHPKKMYVQEVKKGVEYMGMVVYPRRTVPGRRFVRNFSDAMIKYCLDKKDIDSIIAYLGLMKHVDGKGVIRRALKMAEKKFGEIKQGGVAVCMEALQGKL